MKAFSFCQVCGLTALPAAGSEKLPPNRQLSSINSRQPSSWKKKALTEQALLGGGNTTEPKVLINTKTPTITHTVRVSPQTTKYLQNSEMFTMDKPNLFTSVCNLVVKIWFISHESRRLLMKILHLNLYSISLVLYNPGRWQMHSY